MANPIGNRASSEILRVVRSLKGRLAALPRHLLPMAAVGGVIALIAVIYLGYDLAKGRIAPCEAIFQQTSLGLSTRISFLKTAGELQIGREKLTDLDERAQMTALNLKTCCTVLNAGRLDPEQFLQCKGKARAYEGHVEEIAELVRTAIKEGITTGSLAARAAPEPPAPDLAVKISEKVDAARTVSQEFNRQVVEVRKEQALETLQAMLPQEVVIDAQEREPNDDALSANAIGLDKWVTASVGAAKDADFFVFTTPDLRRDWIAIEFQNRSTTLEPRIELFDAEKTSLGEVHKTTAGADLTYSFVARSATKYVARVSNVYGNSTGVYLLRVLPKKAYDAYEPNDDILNAKTITVATPVTASIMDKDDVDYFSLTSGKAEETLVVEVKNRSTTLQPEIMAYDAAKTAIGSEHNTTPGGDVRYSFKAQPQTTYYLRVRDVYSSTGGDYTLTVSVHQPGNG